MGGKAAFQQMFYQHEDKPQKNAYPISLRYEKMSRGESLDLPSFALVTETGTPKGRKC